MGSRTVSAASGQGQVGSNPTPRVPTSVAVRPWDGAEFGYGRAIAGIDLETDEVVRSVRWARGCAEAKSDADLVARRSRPMGYRGAMPASATTKGLASLGPLGLCAALAACSCSNVPPAGNGFAASPGPAKAGRQGKRSDRLARVANSDPSGIDNQPDWDELARQTKAMVGPRLPDPLPEDRAVVCGDMLDAAVTFYEQTEPNPIHRAKRREELEATRDADQTACEEQTSTEAALCVTLLLGDKNAEFPWLLDQCSRAFPKT